MSRTLEKEILLQRIAWTVFFAAVITIYFPYLLAHLKSPKPAGDFSMYYTAGKMLLKGEGHRLYDLKRQLRYFPLSLKESTFLPFIHPPFEAIPFRFLAALPYPKAYLLWSSANVLFLFLSMAFLGRAQFRPLLAAFAFFPVFSCFLNGQDSLLLFTFLTASLLARNQGKNFLSGFLLGCTVFKPQLAVPLALGFGARLGAKGRHFFFGFLLSAGLWALVSYGMLGPGGTLQFFQSLREWNEGRELYGLRPVFMANFRGLLSRQFPGMETAGGATEWLPLGLWFFALGVILHVNFNSRLYAKDSKGPLSRILDAETVVWTLLASFHLNEHDLVLLLLPLLGAPPLAGTRDAPARPAAFMYPLVFFMLSPVPYLLSFSLPKLEVLVLGELGLLLGCEIYRRKSLRKGI